ncbi:MAG TPA: substrate-binding domain-containing protein, partial [Kofleriaceae bacterium]
MYKMIAFSALAALCVAGCNKKKDEGGGSAAAMTKEDKGPAKGPESAGAVTINGSGSTFQKQFQEVAIEGFSKASKDVKVNYGAGGSGKGRQDFSDMVTDYGCTDGLFKDADAAKAKGGAFLYFPILLGAITVSYNLDG